MSGGTINVINPNTGTIKVDYGKYADRESIVTGGTVVIGATGAPASSNYTVSGRMPNRTINATMTRISTTPPSSCGARPSSTTAITIKGASARFDFAACGPMTYSGAGTFGTAVTPFAGVGISATAFSRRRSTHHRRQSRQPVRGRIHQQRPDHARQRGRVHDCRPDRLCRTHDAGRDSMSAPYTIRAPAAKSCSTCLRRPAHNGR